MINFIAIEGTVESVVPASTKTGIQVARLKINQRKSYKEKLTIMPFEITCFGDVSQVALYQIKKHDTVIVHGRLDSRVNEYKGKEYVNVSVVATQIFVSPNQVPEIPKTEGPKTMIQEIKEAESEFDDVMF